MSGIDGALEGGDYVVENGVRKKVGLSTAAMTAQAALPSEPVITDPAPADAPKAPEIEKPDHKPSKKGGVNAD